MKLCHNAILVINTHQYVKVGCLLCSDHKHCNYQWYKNLIVSLNFGDSSTNSFPHHRFNSQDLRCNLICCSSSQTGEGQQWLGTWAWLMCMRTLYGLKSFKVNVSVFWGIKYVGILPGIGQSHSHTHHHPTPSAIPGLCNQHTCKGNVIRNQPSLV